MEVFKLNNDAIHSNMNEIDQNIQKLEKFEESINSLENFFKDLQIHYKKNKDCNCEEGNIILTTYKNINNINNISGKKIVLIEPLLNTNEDYYNKRSFGSRYSKEDLQTIGIIEHLPEKIKKLLVDPESIVPYCISVCLKRKE